MSESDVHCSTTRPTQVECQTFAFLEMRKVLRNSLDPQLYDSEFQTESC